MTQRDLHHNIKVVQLLDPINANNDAEGLPGAGIDTKGFSSCELVALLGLSGDTLSGSVFFTVIIEESDDDTTFTVVTNAEDVLVSSDGVTAAPDSSGIIATIDAAAEDETKIRIGYIGSKRYVQLKLDFTGTHTVGIPVAMLGILGNPYDAPAAD